MPIHTVGGKSSVLESAGCNFQAAHGENYGHHEKDQLDRVYSPGESAGIVSLVRSPDL